MAGLLSTPTSPPHSTTRLVSRFSAIREEASPRGEAEVVVAVPKSERKGPLWSELIRILCDEQRRQRRKILINWRQPPKAHGQRGVGESE